MSDRETRIELPDDAMIELLQRKTLAETTAMVGAAQRTAKLLIAAGARSLHPDWSEADIAAETLRRISGGTA